MDKNQRGENQTNKKRGKKRMFLMAGILAGILVAIWLMSFAIASAVQTGPNETSLGANSRFKDLPVSHWAYSSIGTMCDSGIVKGYPDQSFKPEKSVSYGEYIKMATVIFDGKDAGNGTGDQMALGTENRTGENWAMNYYGKGLAHGFYTTYDIPEAKLNWQMSRGDMALVISGLLDNEKIENYDQVARNIMDVTPKTKNEYEIVKAYAMGILKGYPDGTFRPEGTLSRAEAAASLYRIIQKKAEQSIASNADAANAANAANAADAADASNKNNISDIADNREDYWKEDWAETEKYQIISPEAAKLKVRVPWNGRLAGFDHNMVGFIYLIKNGKIIEYCRSIPAETYVTSGSHYQLETIDYILCIPSIHGLQKTILLVRNPFREQV